ncbi:hypothetical protein VP466E531_P0006 [Vibrio phage 466E53-1]|nr:hypothetical protein VP466E531_P0006 [Vibrio phage 466E53-1]
MSYAPPKPTQTIITYDPVVYCDHYHIFPNGET